MKAEYIMNQILPILHSVSEDEDKLEKILNFLIDEIYDGTEEQPEIPEEYKEVVRKIAESIDFGLVCYYNPETKAVEEIPKDLCNDPIEYELTVGETWESSFNHDKWDKCLTIYPPDSNESFQIMEDFSEAIEDKQLQSKIINALTHKKPFANFKHIIDNSRYREYWFKFKQQQLEELVWDLIDTDLHGISIINGEIVNGVFDDDGTPINSQDVPIPNLCIICKKHQEEDWEENLFCLLNRNDQKDSDNFKCGAFEKI